MKISQKIILTIVILVLLPSVIIGSIAFSEAKKSIRFQEKSANDLVKQEVVVESSVFKDLTEVMHEQAAKNIQVNMSVARDMFKNLCGTSTEMNGDTLVCNNGLIIDDAQSENTIVKQIKDIVKGHASIFVKLGDGTAKKISTTVTEGVYKYGYIMEPSMYAKVIEKGETFHRYTKIKGIFKTKDCDPLKNNGGEIVGTLCVGISEMDIVKSLTDKFSEVRFGNDGKIRVLSTLEGEDTYGKFVVHDEMQGQSGLGFDCVKEIIDKKEGIVSHIDNGQKRISAYTYFEPYNWLIIADEKEISVTATIDKVRNTIVLSLILFLVLAILVGVLASNMIVSPIKKLTIAGNKIADGEIDTELPEIRSKDEIKDLSDTMNLLVGALRFLKGKK